MALVSFTSSTVSEILPDTWETMSTVAGINNVNEHELTDLLALGLWAFDL